MASVKVSSHTPFPFEKAPSIPCDESLSSYLTLMKEKFPLELNNTNQERLSCQISIGSRCKASVNELGIFSAEKYFNGEMDHQTDQIPDTSINTTISTPRTPSKKEQKPSLVRTKSRTGITSSQASIGNSRKSLLRRSPSVEGQRGKKFLGIFPCSCSEKNSVQVESRDSRSRTIPAKKIARIQTNTTTNIKHIERKPALCLGDDHQLRELRIERLSLGLNDNPFRFFPPKPTSETIQDMVSGPEDRRQSSALSRSPSIPVVLVDSEDTRSESSSELFEIESISTTSHPFFRRDGSATPATGYEPSEASIEWSVVTASAADFSIASETNNNPHCYRSETARTQRPSGFLLGCVNEKAVSVVGDGPGGCNGMMKEKFGMEGSVTTVSRYRAESCGVVYLNPAGAGARVN